MGVRSRRLTVVVLRTDGQPFCVRLDAPLGKPVAGIVSKVLKACAKKFGDECWALGEARIRHGVVVVDGAKEVDALEDGATLVVERASARRPGVRMLVFVACHCDAELRAASLERCLASLTGAQICVSWHATTRALARRVAAALAGLPPGAVALESAAPLSQFEHYRALYERAAGDDAYVIFSDDDDLSHPLRSERFARAAAAAREYGVDAVQLPLAATGPAEARVEAPGDVDALLSRGGGDVRTAPFPKEHWTVCVSLPELGRFLRGADPALLAHRFADVVFARWATARAARRAADVFGGPPPWARREADGGPRWLYFYRRHGYESHVQWLVTPTPEDIRIAAASGADANVLVAMRRRAERAVSEGAFDDVGAEARLRRATAVAAEAVKTDDPRHRALHQHLAPAVAEGVLRTFRLPP